MTALSAYRDRARSKYPSIEVELEDGFQVRFVSLMECNDQQIADFETAQKLMAERDEAEDFAGLRTVLVEMLASVSSAPDRVRASLGTESLGTVVTLFEDFQANLPDAAKSPADTPAA